MENDLEKLDNKQKEIIEMYITARQFKNAVDITEMIIIPAARNKLQENTKLNFGNILSMTARGDKMINKILPFIVNKAFACEIFLKIIILMNDLVIPFGSDGHKLDYLYNIAKTNNNLEDEIINNGNLTSEFVDNEMEKLSNVFVKWRYIYEKPNEAKQTNYGFLNLMCDRLDSYVIGEIKSNYKYDVEKDCR